MSIKPRVPKVWLYFVSGVVWLAVGSILIVRSFFFVHQAHNILYWVLWVATFIASCFLGRRFMGKIALKNIKRLDNKDHSHLCFFAFQPWRSYLLVAMMMSMGIFLRKHPLPSPEMIVLYAFMGGALINASWLYFEAGFARKRTGNTI
ncbi:hypothetical protein Thein_1993 [Thermodesulfatator indicus DSM 15286]|uniref:Transmembrane protein n=1 Tax=Thermodesulfatator indicus (strain DSM 15286 / JCM 11887 / CIR29812) TaxID=667014 RepID=F8ACR5_THEID|nr:hypothetical protein [Thermodesulfatator indicus]AEH45846.1 hypothetical protein Thein_1993 [Thermodesulfatator indicus DSM 15286]